MWHFSRRQHTGGCAGIPDNAQSAGYVEVFDTVDHEHDRGFESLRVVRSLLLLFRHCRHCRDCRRVEQDFSRLNWRHWAIRAVMYQLIHRYNECFKLQVKTFVGLSGGIFIAHFCAHWNSCWLICIACLCAQRKSTSAGAGSQKISEFVLLSSSPCWLEQAVTVSGATSCRSSFDDNRLYFVRRSSASTVSTSWSLPSDCRSMLSSQSQEMLRSATLDSGSVAKVASTNHRA
jgi:hypothetical protein